jgi:predicted alpha/beta superfamily hydrolase
MIRVSHGVFTLLLAVIGAPACGQSAMPAAPHSPPAGDDSVLRIGDSFQLSSKVLKEERRYWVHLPETYKPGKPSPTTYPVLYVLEGESNFQPAVAMVDFLTTYAMIPEMIVVGLTTTDRIRDMTPTQNAKGPHGDADPSLAHSGGAEAFERFLETELIPKIESTYPTMPYRVLAGHSLGGLLSLHAVLKNPAPFQAVIAMDPALWWDDQVVVKQAAARLSKPDPRLTSIYVSTGALPLDNGEDATEGRAATKAFGAILDRSASPRMRAKVQTFERDNHQSVRFPSLYDGLLYTFEGYKIATSALIDDPSRIDAHYREISAKFGVEMHAPQRVMDLVSFSLLFEKKKVDEAIAVLERSAKTYPHSAAAHEHLARAYLVKGDKASAIRCYERAVELDPTQEEMKGELAKLRKE